MSLEALVETLTRQAHQTAAEDRQRTASEVRHILADAARERDQRREAARVESEDQYRRDVRARLAQARRDARHLVLKARARLLDRIFERVVTELPALERSPDLVSVAPDLLRDALGYFGDEPVEVRCPPILVDVLQAAASGHRKIKVVVDGNVGAGVSLRTSDGRVTIANTMEARLHRMKDDLAIEVVRRFDRMECHSGVT